MFPYLEGIFNDNKNLIKVECEHYTATKLSPKEGHERQLKASENASKYTWS